MIGSYLLLGSNLGKRILNIEKAKELLSDNSMRIQRESKIYESEPWGVKDQPWFLNQAIEIDFTGTPEDLLEVIKSIEQKIGRVKKRKWGERLIDIDILYLNNQILNTPHLVIPHPEIQNRNFALKPLMELSQDFIHPVLFKTQEQLQAECTDKLICNVYLKSNPNVVD